MRYALVFNSIDLESNYKHVQGIFLFKDPQQEREREREREPLIHPTFKLDPL
jgi:hypothetical protein